MKHIRKSLGVLVLVLLLPPSARADFRLEEIPEGTLVRVSSQTLGLAGKEGKVAMAGSRGLIVDFAGLKRTPVPLPDVDHLEICRYRGRATFQGAAAGFGLGALVGAYASVSNDVFSGSYEHDTWGGILLGAGIGTVVGAVVGSTITYESWRPIIWYPSDPSVGSGPGIGFTSTVSTEE